MLFFKLFFVSYIFIFLYILFSIFVCLQFQLIIITLSYHFLIVLDGCSLSISLLLTILFRLHSNSLKSTFPLYPLSLAIFLNIYTCSSTIFFPCLRNYSFSIFGTSLSICLNSIFININSSSTISNSCFFSTRFSNILFFQTSVISSCT